VLGNERRRFGFCGIVQPRATEKGDDAATRTATQPLSRRRGAARQPEHEWTPLFYRILQNGIRDWHRRQAVRNRVMVWFGRGSKQDPAYDPVASAPDPAGRAPDEELQTAEAMERLESAVAGLPARQREAFMLRTFEGLDVAGTAIAMGCSAGSVKTHYSRAVHTLRDALGDYR
jgi:RNA polymerase sigma-70 factor (ECF subfamily)